MKNKLLLSLVLCILFSLNGMAQSAVFESLKFDSKKLGKYPTRSTCRQITTPRNVIIRCSTCCMATPTMKPCGSRPVK